MMLAKLKLSFVVFSTLHLGAANIAALAGEQAELPVTESNDKLFSFIGKVVSIPSGDSVRILLPDGKTISVRLAGIESPSPDDPVGNQSRLWLSRQLHMQLVTAECVKPDELLHCIVFPDHRNINIVSLYHGFSRRTGNQSIIENDQLYRSAERHARESEIGVWNPGYQSVELK